MKADANDPSQARNVEDPDKMSEAEIDDTLEDTFPASDPPSWTLGSDHRPADNQGREDAAEKNQDVLLASKEKA